MKRIVALRSWRVAAALTVVLGVAGGAYAAIPDASGTINGCYRTSIDDQKGQLRVVEDPASCRNNEQPIQWQQQGPAGPPGPQGPPGEEGEDGADGADGVSPTVAQLAPGDEHCAAGGAAITDAAGTTAYVCNGADGADGADGEPFDGTFTSANGQYSISVTDGGVRIASPDSSIDVTAGAIRVESTGLDLIELRGANRVEVRSGADFLLQAGGGATVGAGGTFSVGGALVRLGGGCAPAARVGDTVAGGAIVTGSSVVCIG